jgi:hypothetical protein
VSRQLVVWKFGLVVEARQTLAVPTALGHPARFLYCSTQRNRPFLWALVDPQEPTQARHILTMGTGHPLPEDVTSFEHLGSYQIYQADGSPFVGHLFEIPRS